MSSIADKIIENNSRPQYHQSETVDNIDKVISEYVGENVYLSALREKPVDHLVARMIIRNTLYVDPFDNSIWNSRVRITENAKTIIELADYYDKVYHLPNIYPLVYNRLRELLPRLSRDKLWISPTLLFNRKTGELEEQLPKENHI